MKKFTAILAAMLVVILSVAPAFAYDYNGALHYALGEMGGYDAEVFGSWYDDGYTYFTMVNYVSKSDGNINHFMLQTNAPFIVDDESGTLRASQTMKCRIWSWRIVDEVNRWLANPNNTRTLGEGVSFTISDGFNTYNPVANWSAYNLYDHNGALYLTGDNGFFPVPPLAEQIQGVTLETLEGQTIPEVTGTMKTLALCGVGCLALLTSLVLLSRKFWTFL